MHAATSTSLHPVSSSTAAAQRVDIDLDDRSYAITIGAGLLADPATYQSVPKAATALIVTNTTVAPLYAQQLQAALASKY